MASKNAEAFIRAMSPEVIEPPAPPSRSSSPGAPNDKDARTRRPPKPEVTKLKHFGGYLDDETFEKIALLKVRLKKDNSELIRFAIDELHRTHKAKRAFGDA